MLNGKRTIGVLIFDLTSYYQEQLCRSLITYGNQLDFNVLIFSASTIYGYRTNNALGEYNIINLPPYEDFDALIVCHDTFYNDYVVTDTWAQIENRVSCPVISMRGKRENSHNILIDTTNGISEMIRHFHDIHHFDRIATMTGPLSNEDAVLRLQNYKDTLQELNLPIREEYIFEGDFWNSKSREAARHFSSLPEPPQAIVCANDYMALSLCKELILLGYMIPDDFAISGFDNIRETNSNLPPITTCSVSVEDMATLAIDTIYAILQGKDVPQNQYVAVSPLIRNSCGCNMVDLQSLIVTRTKEMDRYDQLLSESIHNTFTSIALENLNNAASIKHYLQVTEHPSEANDFYLCLGESKEADTYPKTRIKEIGFAEYSTAIYSIRDLQDIETPIPFPTKELLPKEAIRDEAMAFFFFPIHHLEYNFGYVAASPNQMGNTNPIFHEWLSIIGNALENVRIKEHSKQLLNELNTLYVQDALTSLYNRRGFEQFSKSAFKKIIEENSKAMVLSIDMDNLKTINDVYGHAHGDLALKAIATAMIHAKKGDEICARMGGDEFAVFANGYDEKQAKEYIQDFYKHLDEYNESSNQTYRVTASCGYSIATATGSQDLEFYIKLSDDRLYEDKRQRKAKYGDLSLRT